LRQVKEIQG